jgi:hypothetical protein
MLLSEYFKSELPVSKLVQDAERLQSAKGKERKQSGGYFVDLTNIL